MKTLNRHLNSMPVSTEQKHLETIELSQLFSDGTDEQKTTTLINRPDLTASVDSFSTVNIKIPITKGVGASLDSIDSTHHVASATKPIVVDYNGPNKAINVQQHSSIGLKP